MKKSLASLLWGLVVAGSVLFSLYRLTSGPVVDTSLLSLLPAAEGDPLLTEANALLSQRASHLMAFLVGHPEAAKAGDMAQQLQSDLKQSSFVHQVLTDMTLDQQKSFFDLYFPFRYQMLSSADRQRLHSGAPIAHFTGRLTAALYGPGSSFLKNIIPQDPLLFFPELVRSWIDQALPESGHGQAFVDKDGFSYVLTAVELSLDPFDSKDQDRMLAGIQDLKTRLLTQWPGSRLYMSGVLPFASAERLRTEREMKWVSLVSLIGVLLLTFGLFGSLRALLMAALPIGVGFLVAVAATLLVFGHIHIITFAFGSSLIGVAIDYPLLYLASIGSLEKTGIRKRRSARLHRVFCSAPPRRSPAMPH